MKAVGLEPTTHGLKVHGETNENIGSNDSALHWAQQSFPKWAVFRVNREGQIIEQINSSKSYESAVSFAAGWASSGNADSVIVVVPEHSCWHSRLDQA